MGHFDAFAAADASGLRYWDLHVFLLLPTLWLLTVGKPQMLVADGAPGANLKQTASYSFVAFILAISVAQAFIWDSVGAEIGIWEFNPVKCTGLGGDASLLPVEEVAWLFHHVMKAALWQLKVAELEWTAADEAPSTLPEPARDVGNWALGVVAIAGVYGLLDEADSLKCVGLVAAFFAPVFLIIFNLGRRYWRSHWKLFLWGWLPPGLWTVAIDCLGQQQDVWYFPPRFLTGIDAFGGWLKLDIAVVYLVSTLAVTATGAIIFAAIEEFSSRARRATASGGEFVAAGAVGQAPPPQLQVEGEGRDSRNLWNLGLFIFDGAFPGSASWPSRTYLDRFLPGSSLDGGVAREASSVAVGAEHGSAAPGSSSSRRDQREQRREVL